MSESYKYETEVNVFTRQEVNEIREAVEGRHTNTNKKKSKIGFIMIVVTLFYINLALFNYYIIPFISNNPLTF